MLAGILKFFFNEDNISSTHWRTELLNWILRGTAVLATFAVAAGSVGQWEDGRVDLVMFFCCAWLLVILVTFHTGLNYHFRAVVLTATYYMIGLSEFTSAGVTGDGNMFMANFVILSLILFNFRTGILNFIVALTSILVIAWFILSGKIILPEHMGTQSVIPISWVTAGISFTFMTAVLFISVNYLVNRLGLRDKLTSVYNRHDFQEILLQEIKKAERLGYTLSLLLLDIDNFKFINDNFSHSTGDAVLQEFARLLRKSVRDTDRIFRWGGEEFIIISGNTSEKNIMAFADKIRKRVEKHTFPYVGKVTTSIGTSKYKKVDTIDEFINRADNALQSAKESGKNRVRMN